MGSISEFFIPQIVGAKTARVAQQKLASSRKLHALLNNISLKLSKEEYESIAQYTQHAKAMYDQILALNNGVSELDLVQVIINSLDFNYQPFIRSLQQ